MELFLLDCTKKQYGAYLTLEKINLRSEARKLLRMQYEQSVQNITSLQDLRPVGRPKFYVMYAPGVDPFDVLVHIGWKQEFAKWANFLQA